MQSPLFLVFESFVFEHPRQSCSQVLAHQSLVYIILMTFSKMFSPSGAGQQCCYSKPANGEPGSILPFRLGNGQLAGGTFDRVHPKGGFRNYVDHILHDVLPFSYCCVPSSRSECDSLYSGMRYTDDCSDYVPPRPGGCIEFQVTNSM